MPLNTEVVYIFWTCRNEPEAQKIINALLNQHLIACASVFPEITSFYRWQGVIETSQEVKIILKTQSRHFNTIQTYIQTHCSYEVPEIVQVEISQGNPLYMSWILQETAS